MGGQSMRIGPLEGNERKKHNCKITSIWQKCVAVCIENPASGVHLIILNYKFNKISLNLGYWYVIL
jgi:hypothetical protein